MGWREAPLGHRPWGRRMSALEGVGIPGASRTHCGDAEEAKCVLAGHGKLGPHLGEQNEPGMPVMVTFASEVWHAPVDGLLYGSLCPTATASDASARNASESCISRGAVDAADSRWGAAAGTSRACAATPRRAKTRKTKESFIVGVG